MSRELRKINAFFYVFLFLFSFSFNFFYANLGVFPIDTFAFFDTGYNILLDRHPFKDIWVTTGPVVDYLQAFFFKIFGLNWTSYVIHSSLLNGFLSVFFYSTLIRFNLNRYLSLFYSLSLSILAYTISGTPFAYIHSYVFSLISMLIFFHCIKFKSKISFFFLPLFIFLAFFSMQNPSTFMGANILIFLLIYFYYNFDSRLLIILLIGSISTIILFLIYLNLTKTPIENIWIQYFLFPLSIGENRIIGNELAHISLAGRSTFRNILGHFKFIDFYIVLFLIITIKEALNKKLLQQDFIINSSLILLSVSLIFNQLITSNQTFIFSMIPFLGAFFHFYFKKKHPNFIKTQLFLILIILFCTIKYHSEYNTKRKFMDLQNKNLKSFISGSYLHEKFRYLKWITPNFNGTPKEELTLINEAAKYIKEEKRSKMLLTDYQFFSLLLEENLNIPNRWYTHDNNSYPLKGHKYFVFYKEHLNKIIKNKNVKVIFTVGSPDFKKYQDYLINSCFNEIKINELTKSYVMKNCK